MKLLIQRLFQLDIGWDTPIPDHERKLWCNWVTGLPALESVTCPRVLIPNAKYDKIFLCTFSDASLKGYAAVSYIVCQYGDVNTVSFGLGKIRVAPAKKNLTVPRLELLGAVLAVDIAKTV